MEFANRYANKSTNKKFKSMDKIWWMIRWYISGCEISIKDFKVLTMKNEIGCRIWLAMTCLQKLKRRIGRTQYSSSRHYKSIYQCIALPCNISALNISLTSFEAITTWLASQVASFYDNGSQKLVPLHDKSFNNTGNCVKK